MRKIILSLILVLFLVGSVYGATGRKWGEGCITRPIGIYPNIRGAACFGNWYYMPGNTIIDWEFEDKSWTWASNCYCEDWNKAVSDNNLGNYDHKRVVDDTRWKWGVWEYNNIPEGLLITSVKGEQLNPEYAFYHCLGKGVGVYPDSVVTNDPINNRPVEITYLRCDTSSLTQDGSQKVYPQEYYKYDLMYGTWQGNTYLCGYNGDMRTWGEHDRCLGSQCFTNFIPMVGITVSELDPNAGNPYADIPSLTIKSNIKTNYAHDCNPNRECPAKNGCPGDLNGDGKVDAADVAYLTEFWMRADCSPNNGCCGGADIAKCPGETGNTGRVNACDLAVISENFGKSCKDISVPPPSMVCNPGTDPWNRYHCAVWF